VSVFSSDDLNLSPERVAELLESGEIELIDVREAYEWEAGRIDGARHIELERLASQAETLDRDRPVIFVCRLGARAGMAAQAFRSAGYEAFNMAGGTKRWADGGLPLDPSDGHVADH